MILRLCLETLTSLIIHSFPAAVNHFFKIYGKSQINLFSFVHISQFFKYPLIFSFNNSISFDASILMNLDVDSFSLKSNSEDPSQLFLSYKEENRKIDLNKIK